MYDVICMGSASIDAFEKAQQVLKLRKGNSPLMCFKLGSKLLTTHMEIQTGGGGTNSAVSLRRLGLKTAYLGKLADDLFAQEIIKDLKKEKVSIIKNKPSQHGTGLSVILEGYNEDRTILVYKGSNNYLSKVDAKLNQLKTKWFYCSSLMDESFKTLEYVLKYAKKKNIKVMFNPSEYLAVKGKNYLKNILKCTTILVLNDDEASLLVGRNKLDHMAKELCKLGPKIIVITLGKNGAYCYDGIHNYHLDAFHAKVLDPTGAGDSFASAFLAGYIKKNDIKFAMKLGMANSASCIEYYGAKPGLLSYNKALQRINKNKNVKFRKWLT